ncbi:MAG: PD40 domain-containing protein, partial [Bacteroidaceae bacterium]|nr:PD40 domain-containing protein [Bacteroidaceae bacterium]
MKKRLLLALLCAGSLAAGAQITPRWLRNCAISPDGATIAFTYKDDIYTVKSGGGEARQLTSKSSYDSNPVWSPDGKQIAFSSDREGSVDVWIVDKDGGTPRRLTTNSQQEIPVAFLNSKEILYITTAMPDAGYIQFPSGTFAQMYKVPVEGGRPVLFSSIKMENPSVSSDGKSIIYHDIKGYEDKWRKHHTSSVTRDIWMCNIDGERKFTRLTTNKGEDRNPVWAADGNTYYYLSEQGGSANVYRATIDGGEAKAVTNHTKHPVRFLSIAKNGTLCYAYDGDIYTLAQGGKPKKVKITVNADIDQAERRAVSYTSGANAVAATPNGKEVAFTLRGDVFVTTTEYATTRRITDTPEQERNVDISPDGRSIVYSAERNGVWGIYITKIKRDDEKYFTYASELEEEPLVTSGKVSFQPKFSPDGKEVAFLENRTTLRVINLKSKKVRTVLDGKFNYSYSDGDQEFTWSPDSKWFLVKYISVGGWNNTDIALVKADGSGEVHNLTESGYSDAQPRWVLGGKAMIWSSDRAGYRSHGSWGAHRDIYIMFFDAEEYDKFRMNKEELAMYEEEKKMEKEAADKAKAESE